jgi:hypothetical protein
MSSKPVALQFKVAAYGEECEVTVDGRTLDRIRLFELRAAYEEVTTVRLEGILSDGSEVSYSGRLLPDNPESE